MRILAVLAVIALLATAASAQGVTDTDLPRTPWGHPDLQGVWDYRTTTPLERPEGFGDTPSVEAGEISALEQLLRQRESARQDRLLSADWGDRFDVSLADGRRTSLIIDPPSGRMPVLTPQGAARQGARRERFLSATRPEDRTLSERCLVDPSAPVRLSTTDNNLQVLQTPETVVVVHERIHEAIIIPLDGRPHLPATIRQWRGDSRGRWEGDTLVVETVGRRPEWTISASGFLDVSPHVRVVERFRLIDRDTLRYAFTIDDPASFVQVWTAEWPMRRTEGPIYEYACHEGNRSMSNILSGARAAEGAR